MAEGRWLHCAAVARRRAASRCRFAFGRAARERGAARLGSMCAAWLLLLLCARRPRRPGDGSPRNRPPHRRSRPSSATPGSQRTTSTNSVRATAFTTGTGTYTLSSVAIYSPIQVLRPPRWSRFTGTQRTIRGHLVATMTNPATVADNTLNVYTAPANTTLAPARPTGWSRAIPSTTLARTFGSHEQQQPGQRHGSGMEPRQRALQDRRRVAPWTNSSNRHRFQIRGTDRDGPPPTAPRRWRTRSRTRRRRQARRSATNSRRTRSTTRTPATP